MPSTIVSDKPIVKPTQWEGGELKPMRLAGRPRKTRLVSTPRSQLAIYSQISRRSQEIIKGLFRLAESKNERVRLDAYKVLLDKVLPNKKIEEFGSKHAPVSVFINNQGFIPPDADAYASSKGSSKRSAQIQGSGVASEGEEDDDSDQRDGETGDSQEGSILAPISDLR